MSQMPAVGRHTVVDARKALAGQVVLDPVQFSATSQTPAEARHTIDDNASGGHAALAPVHVSSGSHTPADGRQT
jgi:hypothetical protein